MQRRHFLRASAASASAFGILRLAGACRPADGTGAGDAAGFSALRDRYFVKALAFAPVAATYVGGDGYSDALADVNATLRDVTPSALDAERAFYREVQEQLGAIRPEALSPALRVDHAVLGAQVGFLLHQLVERRYHERAVDSYVAEPFRGVDWQVQQMTDVGNGQLGTEPEWERVARRVEAIPHYLEAARDQLARGKASGNLPDRRMVQKDGIAGSTANAEYFRTTLPATAKPFLGDRPFAATLLARLDAAGGKAATAWADFARFLGATYDPKDPEDRFVAGEVEYAWRIKHCLRLERSVADLFDYGAAQVAEYERRLVAVAEQVATAAKLGLSFASPAAARGSVRAVMDWLGKDSPRDDDELLRWYVEAGRRAVQYGRDQGLFDIPADYRLDVYPTPPVLRSTIEAAYYPAPPFRKSGVGRFYLTPTGSDPAALRLNNRASVADTAVHEGFPGHDWHYKYMTQHAAGISNIRWFTPGAVEDSSSMWIDSMATEGWGLYSEELMAEPATGHPAGFYSPAELLYELQGQLLRAVRVHVDTGIHSGRMGFDEAVDYFCEHVNFVPGARARAASDATARAVLEGAERALYRYSKWPTQAICYNLGKGEIVALREAARERQGARFSAKAFHEAYMGQGPVAPGFFREALLG